MYKRLAILSLIIVGALGSLSWLGYRAINVWAQGLEGMHMNEYVEVAEQIRTDVKRKLDTFIEQEQLRPYTDYQYYYIPELELTEKEDVTLQLSPLAGQEETGLGFNNFQINPDNTVTTPIVDIGAVQEQNQRNSLFENAMLNTRNIRENLMPRLDSIDYQQLQDALQEMQKTDSIEIKDKAIANLGKVQASKGYEPQQQSFEIESLQNRSDQVQIEMRSRDFVVSNQAVQSPLPQQQVQPNRPPFSGGRGTMSTVSAPSQQSSGIESLPGPNGQIQPGTRLPESMTSNQIVQRPLPQQQLQTNRSGMGGAARGVQNVDSTQQQQALQQDENSDIVEVRIEPFVPIVIKSNGNDDSIFGGQVYMLRRITIEDQQYYQGFQLNEQKLLDEVEQSTQSFIREGMSYEMGRTIDEQSTFTAVLDFGFGHLLLNLIETNPDSIGTQIVRLQSWYFSILALVFLVVTSALGSLWLAAVTQTKLTRKKDDFVSAVSHELRTPLTSIRMHAEMLEKNWVKSQDKLAEYYGNIRQESERLSRLIDNVLDFSRIQRGRKKYRFSLGDINKCIAEVAEMMSPYAEQKGFTIKTEFSQCGQISFDRDAISQIVVNLLDNAIKYAAGASDKTIIIRTKCSNNYTLIEVEDHGPGVPHRQRNKIFEQFYRIGSENTRETPGSGLGLALVKRFALAHNGFVEIINARPTGAVFRVALLRSE